MSTSSGPNAANDSTTAPSRRTVTRLELWRHARRSKLQRFAEGVARLVQERLLVRPADQVGIALRRLAENRVERQLGRDSLANSYRRSQRLAAVTGVQEGHTDAGDPIRC